MAQTRKELLEEYQKLLDIQLSDGNWNYDPYMHGMANGMLLFYCMAENDTTTPNYKSPPEYWKSHWWRKIEKLKILRKELRYYFKMGMRSIISNITGLEIDLHHKPGIGTERYK